MKNNSFLIIMLSCIVIGLHAQEKNTNWENGNLKAITNYDKDGNKTGYWATYYKNGELEESGYYEYGKKNNTWTEYYMDGTRRKTEYYVNGLISEKSVYYESGKKMVSGYYDKNGKMHGRWQQYYDNWNQKLKSEYVHGKKHGQWKYYTESGELFKIENYNNGVRTSKGKSNNQYNNTNTTAEVVVEEAAEVIEEVQEVEIIEYTEDASESVEAAVDIAGDATASNYTASVKAASHNYYGDGLNGEWEFYNDNDKVIEKGNFINDKKEGKWTYYYDNGQLKKEEVWAEGNVVEVVSYFDANGKPLNKGTLKNGNGTLNEYDANGKLISSLEYNYGEKLDWNDSTQLNNLAWNVYENETDIKALNKAIKWVKRSIELDKSYYNTDTHAALLYKTGKYKQALALAQDAISIAKEEGDDYSSTTKLVAMILQKMKK